MSVLLIHLVFVLSGGKRGTILREVTIQVIDPPTCDQAYLDKRGRAIPKGITSQFLCAGVPEGGKDACQVKHLSESLGVKVCTYVSPQLCSRCALRTNFASSQRVHKTFPISSSY